MGVGEEGKAIRDRPLLGFQSAASRRWGGGGGGEKIQMLKGGNRPGSQISLLKSRDIESPGKEEIIEMARGSVSNPTSKPRRI